MLVWNTQKDRAVSQKPKKIGAVYSRQQTDVFQGFKEGLKQLGYGSAIVEERIIVVGPTMNDDIKKATEEFIAQDVDLIWTGLEHLTREVLKVTKAMNNNTPIVFASKFHDPIEYGLAKSWKSSGNNATGVTANIIEVVQKQLEFLGRINPRIKKIGVFSHGFMVPEVGEEYYAELKVQAGKFGYQLVEYTTTVPPPETEHEWKKIAATIRPGDIDAIYHVAGHFFGTQEVSETELAKRLHVIHMAPVEDLPTGGHFGYSPNQDTAGKETAILADKIFKGEQPSNIPIESLGIHTLVLYEKRANEAGIQFPASIRSLADSIIKE